MRVTDIPLTDIMQKYLNSADFVREGHSNRWKTKCPFHGDTSPSLVLYDKTEDGAGWDYHCFSCGAHGNAMTMMSSLKISQSDEHAVEMLMRDFDMQFPDKVTLVEFCKFKGLDYDFAKDNGWKTSQQGVEIPFYGIKHDVLTTKIRVKYQGKDKYIYKKQDGSPISQMIPYGLHWTDAYDDTVLYITEGETDAMTMRQAGFQALGFPSTNGFKPEFATFLTKYKTLVVVRDNDEAGWRLVTDIAELFPSNIYMVQLPKGTKDINAFHLAKCRADIENFKVMFPALQVLPASPDAFITAVKQEKVIPTEKACWDMVIRYYKNPADQLYFKERMNKEAKVGKAVLNAVMKSLDVIKDPARDTGEFTVIDNSYYKVMQVGQRSVEIKVSNFILVPEYDIRSDDEIIRVVTLVNQLGEEKKGVRLDSEAMTSTNRFNMCIVSSGNYIFTGTTEDLFKLCIMIFERSKKTVYSPKKIGRLETGGWLFGNCGIDSKGILHKLKHGVITLDEKVYAPRSIVLEEGDVPTSQDIPTFNLKDYPRACHPDFLRDTAGTMRSSFGTYGIYLALGWCVAGWFSDQIFSEYGFYPYLFVSGKRSSGKSVLSTMLQGVYGFDSSGAGMSIETPSNVGILRYLGYRSSLPSWYDDYRVGVRRIQMKDGLLLDVYNRHGSVKGTKERGEIVQEQVNGFVLLSGEDVPENNALLTRCVIVQLSATERDEKFFDEAKSNMDLLRVRALNWAKKSTRNARNRHGETLLESINKITDRIFTKNGDIRYARNYGIFAGAFLWAFGDHIPDKREFINYLTDNAYTAKVEIDSAHPMAEFFNDFPDMIAKGFIVRDRDFSVSADGHVGIRIRECHKGWVDYHKTTNLAERTLRDYIRKEPFFHSEDRVYYPSAGRFRSIIVRTELMKAEFEDFCEAVLRDSKEEPY